MRNIASLPRSGSCLSWWMKFSHKFSRCYHAAFLLSIYSLSHPHTHMIDVVVVDICLTMVFIILRITETTFSHFILRCTLSTLLSPFTPASSHRHDVVAFLRMKSIKEKRRWCENLARETTDGCLWIRRCVVEEISAEIIHIVCKTGRVEGGNELTRERVSEWKIKNEVTNNNLQRNEADCFNKQSKSVRAKA